MSVIDTRSVGEVLNTAPAFRGRFVKLRGFLIIGDLENARLIADLKDAFEPSRSVGLSAPDVLALFYEANLGPYVGGDFMYNDSAMIEGLLAPAPMHGFPLYFSRIESISINRDDLVTIIRK